MSGLGLDDFVALNYLLGDHQLEIVDYFIDLVWLVRIILEYGSTIWDPQFNVYSKHIESVQKQLLLFCLRGFGWNYLDMPSYTSRLALIKLPTLKSRRTMLNIFCMLNSIFLVVTSAVLILFIHNSVELIMLLLIR